MSRKMIVISSRGLDNRHNLEGRSLLGPTAQWLSILGEGTNNSYAINEFSYCNFLVLDVIIANKLGKQSGFFHVFGVF